MRKIGLALFSLVLLSFLLGFTASTLMENRVQAEKTSMSGDTYLISFFNENRSTTSKAWEEIEGINQTFRTNGSKVLSISLQTNYVGAGDFPGHCVVRARINDTILLGDVAFYVIGFLNAEWVTNVSAGTQVITFQWRVLYNTAFSYYPQIGVLYNETTGIRIVTRAY